MKKSIQILLLIAFVSVFTHESKADSFASPATTEASPPISLVATESPKIRIFGIGKPKYNKRRIDRQNMPGPVFRRGRRIQRKNGLGYTDRVTLSTGVTRVTNIEGLLTINAIQA